MFHFKHLTRGRITLVLPPIIATLVIMGLLAWTTPAQAYITVARWQTSSSEWRNSVSGAPFPSNTTSLIDSAAQKWSKPATGKNFSLVNYQNISGPTRITVSSANFAANGWPDDPGVTRVSFSGAYVAAAPLYVNNTWSWNTSCSLNQAQKQADFRVVVLHELGHTVVLNHDANQKSAVMWPDYTCKLNLTQDDKNGIGALYP